MPALQHHLLLVVRSDQAKERRRGGGINESFTVRRIASHSVGVERTFLIHSPRIDKIEVLRFGKVRRSKLYYLRGLSGKAARIKERQRPNGKHLV